MCGLLSANVKQRNMGNDKERRCQSRVFLLFHEMEFICQHAANWPGPAGVIKKYLWNSELCKNMTWLWKVCKVCIYTTLFEIQRGNCAVI